VKMCRRFTVESGDHEIHIVDKKYDVKIPVKIEPHPNDIRICILSIPSYISFVIMEDIGSCQSTSEIMEKLVKKVESMIHEIDKCIRKIHP